MAYSTLTNFVGGATLTATQLNALLDNFRAMHPVGQFIYVSRSATTAETLVDGVWLECNGVSVLRATYPDLNTHYSGLGYPHGTADGTHFTLPDYQARVPVGMASGGHADANALGDSDGLAKASRTPKGTVAVGGTATGTVSGTTGAEAAHTHGAGSYSVTLPMGISLSAPTTNPVVTPGTYAVGGTSGAGSSHTHSFSGSPAARERSMPTMRRSPRGA